MTHHPGKLPQYGVKSATIRVFLVDDSAVVRRALSDVLTADPRFEIVAAVGDPYAAAEKLRSVVPGTYSITT